MTTAATCITERLPKFNNALRNLKIQPLVPEEAAALERAITIDKLRQLVSRAATDANAAEHLRRQLDKVRIQLPAPPDDAAHAPAPTDLAPRAPRPAPTPRSAFTAVPTNNVTPMPERRPESSVTTREAEEPDPPRTRSIDRHGFHIYGGKGALTIEADARSRAKGTIEHVLYVDGALATAPREYNWSDKLTFMLLPTELAGVMAVLCGIIDKLEFRNHGEDKDKSLCIEHQGNCVFLKILHARRAVAVPITPEDAMRMAALTLRQLRLNHFGLGGQEVLALVRSVYSPLKTAANARRQA